MNRMSRLVWWWRSAWGATLAAFGRQPRSRITYRWSRPGPPPDLSRVPRPVWLPPDDELGVATGIRTSLAANEAAALGLLDCVAYSTGFEFTIAYRSRDEIPRELLGAGPPPSPERELSVRISYPGRTGASSSVRGQDEMTAHYEAAYEGKEPPLPSGPIVLPQRGGGGGRRIDYNFWCWPLPPNGAITLTVEWPAAKIAAATVEIDGATIRRASLASKKLWGQGSDASS